MSARKPKIEYYWARVWTDPETIEHRVNWRLVGANGEIMCQSTQGFRDKTDAHRSVDRVGDLFADRDVGFTSIREVGPGRKPK